MLLTGLILNIIFLFVTPNQHSVLEIALLFFRNALVDATLLSEHWIDLWISGIYHKYINDLIYTVNKLLPTFFQYLICITAQNKTMYELIKKNQCPTPATNWDRWCSSLQRYPLHHRWITKPEMQTIIIEYDIGYSRCIICIWRHICIIWRHIYITDIYIWRHMDYDMTSYCNLFTDIISTYTKLRPFDIMMS